MEQIFRLHDKEYAISTEGNFLQVGVLGYADDAALIATSNKATEILSNRLTNISRGSREDADMHLHKGKTKYIHV